MSIHIKRIYLPVGKNDGTRILIDRLWPRGVKKETAKIDLWLKDIAPSHELRKWFNHEPEKWKEFKKRYYQELKACPEAVNHISILVKKGPVTLVFSSREETYNNAKALQEYFRH
ncbi:MAG: DUF488 family protein [Nitrospirae bacterium]|nr:DUF488 family protein [Nitrospirota bacterium]